ncbi:MAG TPA: endolytic transglycosylase MltG, partial [Gemmataceae bacterium]|nr:endolytic transglycosylase MltG [Gemmataceae bacterium]
DSSIIAALYPASSSYLYFVAQPDGKHVFSASYAEHLAAIRRARQKPPAEQRPPGPPRPAQHR